MTSREDILVGAQEIVCEPQRGLSFCLNSYPCVWLTILHVELDIVFVSADGHIAHPTEAITLFLMITESVNANSSLNVAVNIPIPTATDLDNPAVEGGPARLADGDVQSTTVAGGQTETPRSALRHAEEAINTMKTWKSAVSIIKRVMDTVSPIAAVCTISFFTHSLLS
jgi:hypothetical protein